MKSINIYLKLKNTGKTIFRIQDIKTLTGIEKYEYLKIYINRMTKKNLIRPIINGVYYVADTPPTDFEIANNLCTPSYISLESALVYYGIINQVPYTITSVTAKKAKTYNVDGKEYSYNHIKPTLFYPDLSKRDILIASREKAIIDTIYLASFSGENINFDEWELSDVDINKLKTMANTIEITTFSNLFYSLFK